MSGGAPNLVTVTGAQAPQGIHGSKEGTVSVSAWRLPFQWTSAEDGSYRQFRRQRALIIVNDLSSLFISSFLDSSVLYHLSSSQVLITVPLLGGEPCHQHHLLTSRGPSIGPSSCRSRCRCPCHLSPTIEDRIGSFKSTKQHYSIILETRHLWIRQYCSAHGIHDPPPSVSTNVLRSSPGQPTSQGLIDSTGHGALLVRRLDQGSLSNVNGESLYNVTAKGKSDRSSPWHGSFENMSSQTGGSAVIAVW